MHCFQAGTWGRATEKRMTIILVAHAYIIAYVRYKRVNGLSCRACGKDRRSATHARAPRRVYV